MIKDFKKFSKKDDDQIKFGDIVNLELVDGILIYLKKPLDKSTKVFSCDKLTIGFVYDYFIENYISFEDLKNDELLIKLYFLLEKCKLAYENANMKGHSKILGDVQKLWIETSPDLKMKIDMNKYNI